MSVTQSATLCPGTARLSLAPPQTSQTSAERTVVNSNMVASEYVLNAV